MRILITNDDGIYAEGLATLASWARKLGEVVVVAPKQEQSGKSHGIELHKAFEVKEYSLLPDITAYSVDSTPADCVRFAYAGLDRQFDLVLSGINKGFNVGLDIVYSGTCGALFEASAFGVRALAMSTDPASFEPAAEHLDAIYDYIVNNKLFDYNDIFNINIPLISKDILITRQGGPYYKDNFAHRGGDHYIAEGYSVYQNTSDLTLDLDAVMNDYISVTPLTLNRTDNDAYRALSGLNN